MQYFTIIMAFGLLLDILGVIMIYQTEVAPHNPNKLILYSRAETHERQKQFAIKEHRRRLKSKTGLGLLIAGFIVQFACTLLPLVFKALGFAL